MRYYLHKSLLLFLRLLIYTKRGVFWLGRNTILPFFSWLGQIYRATFGLFFYKIVYRIGKRFDFFKTSRANYTIEFFGRRGTLQVILFIIVVIVMIPHSKLYTREPNKIAGRETVLYQLVGPAQDFPEIEEVSSDIIVPEASNSAGWREGSVGVDVPGTVGKEIVQAPKDLSSISSGGTAVTKPTIMPGAELPTVNSSGSVSTGRTEVVYYEVKPGDVIGVIAQKYSLSVTTLLWANGLTSRSYIRPGDQLKILPEDGLTHKVVSGDTVSKIARKYDVGVDDVVKSNRLKNDGSDIVIGEDLFIPGGTMPQPVYTYTAPAQKYTAYNNVVAPPPSVSAPAGSGYLWPTSVRRITQYYGWRHTGVDIAGPVGTPLYATRAGKVIKSQCGYNGGYGCYIILDHGGGIQSLYGHASQLYVSVGQYVNQGQTIAAMGSTGRSTGPHIHFEIRVNGAKVNPFGYIR